MLYKFRRSTHFYLTRKKGKAISVFKKKDIGGYHGSKSLSEADKSLGWTILNEYIRRSHYDIRETPPPGEPVFDRPPDENPLLGLHRLLDRNPHGFVRGDSNTFVVLLDFGRYGYAQQEWEDFSRAHQGIQFVAVSSRRNGVVSKKDNLDWITCGDDPDVAKTLAEYILEKTDNL